MSSSYSDEWAWFSTHTPERSKPTSLIEAKGQPTEFQNLYFLVNRFSLLEETNSPSPACRSNLSSLNLHVPIDCIPVISSHAFLSNAKVKWITGVSLWIDFPDLARVENLGYWMEIAAEIKAYVMSASLETLKEIRHVILYPIFKKDVAGYPWITELLSLALEGVDTFKLWFFQDLSKDFEHWVGIERAVRFGGWSAGREGVIATVMTTTNTPAMSSLRDALNRAYDVSPVQHGARDVTLIVPVDEAGLSNSRDVMDVLHRHKQRLGGLHVRPYSPTLGTPLGSMVKRMGQTRVLVARHGSLLGLGALLPPGSTVVEILPYRYDGFDTFDLFHTMSMWLGDINHLTLPMNSAESVVPMSEDDRKYEAWVGGECYADDCKEAMEFSGVRVDLSALESLLNDIGDTSRYAHPQRAPRKQTHAGVWYDI